ncbi:hypothetical protein H5410_027636 [Solanum commersonii]|uniref:DUF4283 domain-containing protein n=1 Tax=Solanum commersonii TaxID=4109 RepID=A0A9J5Z2G6_SOLCO|nr:hypothetical protein H5410_027636 [Solanum commersonii]
MSRHETNQKGTPSHSHEESTSQKTPRQVIDEMDIEVQSKEQDQRAGQAQNDHLVIVRTKAIEVVNVVHPNSPLELSLLIQIQTMRDNKGQVQQASHTKSQDNALNEEGTQSGKSTDFNLVFTAVILSDSKGKLHMNAKGQHADQHQGKGTDNRVQIQLYKQGGSFEPKPKSQHINNPNQSNDQTNPNNLQHTKKDQISELAPYTVVQTMAARLRHNQAQQETPIELVPPKITSRQGLSAIIYDMDDFMTKLAVDCKYTLIGKFNSTMPKMELIRKSFIMQTQLTRGANIAHYNARHVFIDLENELDYNIVWTQQRMTIEGKLMRIQTWTPNFRPEEETPIVPIWILLPGLPWYCFKKEFITPLLSPIGKVLYLNTTSIKRTIASMANVKVQVDLTKARPRHVWIGLDEEDLTIGRWQTIEYESIPPYCDYCKHQGHMIYECKFKIRDREFKKRKELEVEKKDKNKGEQMPKGNDNKLTKAQENEEEQNQSNKEVSHQRQEYNKRKKNGKHKKEKNNKQQEEKTQKAVWRPTSPQNRRTTQQAGITINPNDNSFTNLNMQEVQQEDMEEPTRDEKTQTQRAKDRSETDPNQATQALKKENKEYNKSTCIDSMLPIPTHPNNVLIDCNVEVEGGLDGGSQEKHSNMQEWVSKGGNLTHLLHEGVHTDHSPDFRASATPMFHQNNIKQQQKL